MPTNRSLAYLIYYRILNSAFLVDISSWHSYPSTSSSATVRQLKSGISNSGTVSSASGSSTLVIDGIGADGLPAAKGELRMLCSAESCPSKPNRKPSLEVVLEKTKVH